MNNWIFRVLYYDLLVVTTNSSSSLIIPEKKPMIPIYSRDHRLCIWLDIREYLLDCDTVFTSTPFVKVNTLFIPNQSVV
ncbi:hypothetical protein O0535_04080 [Brevibacillus halotolerans]|uniref:Uncharacterized protein n=1 Tax=Brevibacillus halotolerans TaxID=1507437 RepID=A0ABT4HT53_9BACL|nr:hypothetical protein [Brevibacillus halotolerans]